MVEEANESRHKLMGELRGGKGYNNPDCAGLNCGMAPSRSLNGSPKGG